MSNLLKRAYSKPDDKMLQQSQTIRNLFDTDKSNFVAYFPSFTDPFSANFQADIYSAHAFPKAWHEITTLKVKTEEMNIQMELSKEHFQKLANYVKLLFPDSAAEQGIFGLDMYDKAKRSPSPMRDLMISAYEKANSADFKADLIALGFVQSDIDNLNSLATALSDASKAQKDYKTTLKLLTLDRIAVYNKVWASTKAISAASKQVFATSYVKLQQYKLYP